MKAASLFIFLALSAVATPLACPPDFVHDGVRVDPACPGLGLNVIATPGLVYALSWNDNNGGGDYDYNDLIASIVISDDGASAVVSWIGGLSADDNQLFDGHTFLFSNSSHPGPVTITTNPNDIILFNLHDQVPGDPPWYPGSVWDNTDHTIHDWVQVEQSGVPEPATAALIGIGLVGLGVWRKKRA